MGRKQVPNRMKKTRYSISISRGVNNRLEETLERSKQTKSDFIERLLRAVLFNDKAYAKLRARELSRELAYWKYEYSLAEGRDEVRQDNIKAWQ